MSSVLSIADPGILPFVERVRDDHIVIEIFRFLCSERALKSASQAKNKSTAAVDSDGFQQRSVLRVVCRDFARILGMVADSQTVPCAELPAMLYATPRSFQWSSVCPKLTTIVVQCSNLAQCQGISDVLYADDILPFWSLLCDNYGEVVPWVERALDDGHLENSATLCRPQDSYRLSTGRSCAGGWREVGFEVNIQLSTKSADGHVIIQGLLACLNRCCGYDLTSQTSLYTRHLNLSQTTIADTCLHDCFPLLPLLEVLDCRRCVNLQSPLRSSRIPRGTLKRVLLDGCWQIDESHLLEFETSLRLPGATVPEPGLFIDLIHQEVQLKSKGSVGEVVILTHRHRGEWVKCTVVSNDSPDPVTAQQTSDVCSRRDQQESKLASYGVYVWETLRFDHAVGFSNALAGNISRKHIRFPM